MQFESLLENKIEIESRLLSISIYEDNCMMVTQEAGDLELSIVKYKVN